ATQTAPIAAPAPDRSRVLPPHAQPRILRSGLPRRVPRAVRRQAARIRVPSKAHLFPAKSPGKRPGNSTADANANSTAHTPAPAKRTPFKALNGAGPGYAVDAMGSGLGGVAPAPRKLGISHLGLLCETVGARMRCRMCLPGTQGVSLSATAPWGELVGHAMSAHAGGVRSCL
ncbi:hypothetical protein B0H17DRAFT_1062392, partial [Mycena rosella]